VQGIDHHLMNPRNDDERAALTVALIMIVGSDRSEDNMNDSHQHGDCPLTLFGRTIRRFVPAEQSGVTLEGTLVVPKFVNGASGHVATISRSVCTGVRTVINAEARQEQEVREPALGCVRSKEADTAGSRSASDPGRPDK
jgi:hypothetical protein